MQTNSSIERNVMRRVRIIHTVRPLISNSALALVLLVVALYGIGREVWVAKVLQNAPHGFTALANFYVYAFVHTHLVVQVLSVLVLGSAIYLAREAARLLVGTLAVSHA